MIIVVVLCFVVLSISIFLVDWFEKNVTNPRIWKDWSCEEMRKYALTLEDEKLNDFQRARFHEDLSLCISKGES